MRPARDGGCARRRLGRHRLRKEPREGAQPLRDRVTLVVGDLCDGAAVAAAVKAARPTAVVDASSALPFGHAPGAPPNSADRGVLLKSTVAALGEDGRLSDCVLLVVRR